MSESRDDRIERYYQESAWELAERIVDLEDQLSDHAHELAEKIRNELPEKAEKLDGFWAEIRTVSTAQHAADLIDPHKG